MKSCSDDGAFAGAKVAVGICWNPGRFEGEPEFGQEPHAWLPAVGHRRSHLGVTLCNEFAKESGGRQAAEPLAPICRVDEEQSERAGIFRWIPEYGVDHADDLPVGCDHDEGLFLEGRAFRQGVVEALEVAGRGGLACGGREPIFSRIEQREHTLFVIRLQVSDPDSPGTEFKVQQHSGSIIPTSPSCVLGGAPAGKITNPLCGYQTVVFLAPCVHDMKKAGLW